MLQGEWKDARTPKDATPKDATWRLLFHRYKAGRLLVRRELLAAVRAADWQRTTSLKRQWEEEPAFPADATDEHRVRLSSGRGLVPGVCFVHRRGGYRGVILACEPWCTAPEAWKRSMNVAELPRGDGQPFYHCVVERGGPGGGISFEAEEDLQLVLAGEENLAFPVTLPLVDGLFERCDQLSGYVPRAPLVWRGKMP